MAKITALPLSDGPDGTEEVPVVQGPPGARQTTRMPTWMLVDSAVRPTQAEVIAAVLEAVVAGSNIALVPDVEIGAVAIALVASPALAGAPTAATAAVGTNSTQVATTAFVQAAIAALVGSSPESLDTLNELAQALGDDPNFATTIIDALAGKSAVGHTHDDRYYPEADVDALLAARLRYYHYGSFAVASIGSSELLLDHDVATAHTLAANFAGCRVSAGTPPAAPWSADVLKNGVAIGSIAIAVDGTVTLATVGGTAVAIGVGDIVTIQAPAAADATLARLRFTMRGNI